MTADEGEALIKAIAGSGKKPVRMRLEAHPHPSYLYDLNKYHHNAIPAALTYQVKRKDLARLDLTFGRTSAAQAMETRVDYPPYAYAAAYRFFPEPVAPGSRTDWVSTDEGVEWQQQVGIPGWVSSLSAPRSYEAGKTYQDRWLAPVVRPVMTAGNLPVRDDSWLSLELTDGATPGCTPPTRRPRACRRRCRSTRAKPIGPDRLPIPVRLGTGTRNTALPSGRRHDPSHIAVQSPTRWQLTPNASTSGKRRKPPSAAATGLRDEGEQGR